MWLVWALAAWLVMLILIVANAYLAEIKLAPRLGAYGTHVYKSLVAIGLIFGVSWIYALLTAGPGWDAAARRAGLLWLALTVVFEFFAGHYLFGNPWEKLIADYRIWRGRLWLLVLAALYAAPPLLGRVLNR